MAEMKKKKKMAQFTLFDMQLIGSFLNMENTTLSGINIDPLFPIQLSLPSPPAKRKFNFSFQNYW